jgi:hypothetical protein
MFSVVMGGAFRRAFLHPRTLVLALSSHVVDCAVSERRFVTTARSAELGWGRNVATAAVADIVRREKVSNRWDARVGAQWAG